MTEKILDMHAHLEYGVQELEVRRSQETAAFFSCGDSDEWEQTFKTVTKSGKVGKKDFYLSFGIHPWHCSGYEAQCQKALKAKSGELWELYKSCDAIGEIGMDSVWCEIPLEIQRQVFGVQLKIAEVLGKPVILHTKGQEKEIAGMLRDFRGKVCIHWYSGEIEVLKQYMEMDCYFTLGPDLGKVLQGQTSNGEDRALAKLYRYMLEHIPAERLFLETDGISAIAWARGEESLPLTEIPAVLKENLRILAAWKGLPEEEMRQRMWDNLEKYINPLFCSQNTQTGQSHPEYL